jgi:hypothetical protein
MSKFLKAVIAFSVFMFFAGFGMWFAGIWTSGNDPLSMRFLTSAFVMIVLSAFTALVAVMTLDVMDL